MDDFIHRWPQKVHGALVEALDHLARFEESPTSDGILGEFVTMLCAMKFQEGDTKYVAALLEKKDPHLIEAGVELATALLRDVDAWGALEGPLARMIAREPVDLWVAEALVALFRKTRAPASVYRAIAARHGQRSTDGLSIMRNRHIQPWRDLEEVYAQDVIQQLEPTEREAAILPVLEKKLGTKGFLATQAKILRDMGFEPEHHRKLLARRP